MAKTIRKYLSASFFLDYFLFCNNSNDFELKNLMGKEGLAMWDHYVDLKKKLRHAISKEDKEKIISEMNRIGSDYNFDAA